MGTYRSAGAAGHSRQLKPGERQMCAQATNRLDTAALSPPSHGHRFERELIALIPDVRKFSRRLCNRRAIAEDMAQQALMKAWRAQDQFEVGTNLKAWLFTILRNEVYSHGRRAWREAHWDPQSAERDPAPPDEQDWAVALSDTTRALQQLPESQRDAIMMVRVGGHTYQEVATLSGQSIGTVKSRVSRGCDALLGILDGDKPLPACRRSRTMDASEHLLAQLNAVKAHSKAPTMQPA